MFVPVGVDAAIWVGVLVGLTDCVGVMVEGTVVGLETEPFSVITN